jgi:predicted secreted protein
MLDTVRSARAFHSFSSAAITLIAVFFAVSPPNAQAQVAVPPPPANVVTLSATGDMDVPQDLLTLSLRTTKEGESAAAVQKELKSALDKALALAQASEKTELMEVRTGQFSLYPRYGKDGRINGWQGTAELLLEGRDFALVSATAGKLNTLVMSHAGFSLSRQTRLRLEKEVQALAIERFQSQARDLAKGFGFAGYTLREVSVSSSDDGAMPMHPRMMAMEAKGAADSSIPVAAGNSTVRVTVSGSIQLR